MATALTRLLRLGRRPVPPVVRDVHLEPGERRVGWALTSAGDPLVATDLGLVVPGTSGDGRRLAWPDIERATWKRPLLDVVEVAAVSGSGQHWRFELADEGELPDVVRSQVTASVAWTSHATLTPAGGVRVVGRRRPGLEVLDWQVVYDRGTDPDDPALQAQAAAVVLEARRTVG